MLQREFFVRELEREWDLIASEEKKLEEEKKKVVAEWVGVEDAQREYDKRREAFEKVAREKFDFLPPDHVVAFNVGGQLFKSTVKIWTRDRFSILAQLCTAKPKLPKLCVEEDAFFFDRDFWIFQFIYAFLRDNTLPDALDVLRELYCEASFYRIGLLRHAIESKMIGDDAMAASVLVASSQVTSPNTTSSLPATRSSASSGSVLQSKVAESSGGRAPSSSNHKYSELPDPFGFTSKKI
ncbi:hypothetical protein Gpo141_00003302 [Globisporangium polare]